MEVKQQLIERLSNRESSLTYYLREYFNITNTKLLEINQSYINNILRYDNAFIKDIRQFLQSKKTSGFILDKLMNLKKLPDGMNERIYLNQMGLNKGQINDKGFFFLKDMDYNFIKNLFDSIDNLKSFLNNVRNVVIEDYMSGEKYISKKKKETIKYNIERELLKETDMLDEAPENQKDILKQNKALIEKRMKDYIAEKFQYDIKEQILNEGFDAIKLENHIKDIEKDYSDMLKMEANIEGFYNFKDLSLELDKATGGFKNIFKKILYLGTYIQTFKNFYFKDYKDVYKKIIIENLKEDIKKTNNKKEIKSIKKKLKKCENHLEYLDNFFNKTKDYQKDYEKLYSFVVNNEYNLNDYMYMYQISKIDYKYDFKNTEKNISKNSIKNSGINLVYEVEKIFNLRFLEKNYNNINLKNVYDSDFLGQLYGLNSTAHKRIVSKIHTLESYNNKLDKNQQKIITKFLDLLGNFFTLSSVSNKKNINYFHQNNLKELDEMINNIEILENKIGGFNDDKVKNVYYMYELYKKQLNFINFFNKGDYLDEKENEYQSVDFFLGFKALKSKLKFFNLDFRNLAQKNEDYDNIINFYNKQFKELNIIVDIEDYEDYKTQKEKIKNIKKQDFINQFFGSDIGNAFLKKIKMAGSNIRPDKKHNNKLDLLYDLILIIKNQKAIKNFYYKNREELENGKTKTIDKKFKGNILYKLYKTYKKEIENWKVHFDLLKINFINEEEFYIEPMNSVIQYYLYFYKVNDFISSYFADNEDISSEYIKDIIKLGLYTKSSHIYKHNLLVNKKLIKHINKQNEFKYHNFMVLNYYLVDYLYKKDILLNKKELGLIDEQDYKVKEYNLFESYSNKYGLFFKGFKSYYSYLNKGKEPRKGGMFNFLNNFIQGYNNFTSKREKYTSFIEKINNQEVIGMNMSAFTECMLIVNKFLDSLSQVAKIFLFYMLYFLLNKNVEVDVNDGFIIIVVGEKAFIMTSNYSFNTINNVILYATEKYKDKEHVFMFLNTDIYFFISEQLKTKLNISGVSILTKNILSYVFHHPKISDIDFYGNETQSISRLKFRFKNNYKRVALKNGDSKQTIFTYGEIKNFIVDMFELGAQIEDGKVADSSFVIGGVKMRLNIMRDGDKTSISIRKGQHKSSAFQGLNTDEIEQKLGDLYNLRPVIDPISISRDNITLKDSYNSSDIKVFEEKAIQDKGLFLFVGKTRSGKTTSIFNLLKFLYGEQIKKGAEPKIMTLEDPIERTNLNYNQLKVASNARAFREMVKGIKRQDPDTLLVGEIRDAQTMLQISEFANMMRVFSTFHVTNPFMALMQLRSYAVQNQVEMLDLINIIKMIVSQKLVSRLKKEKVISKIEEYNQEYHKLANDGIYLYKDKEEIEMFLRTTGTQWIKSHLKMDFKTAMYKFKKGKLNKEEELLILGYKEFEQKIWELYEKQKGCLIKSTTGDWKRMNLYYDFMSDQFINANLEDILQLGGKNPPIKRIQNNFVKSFSLKEEKSLKEFYKGELLYEDLRQLDVEYLPYILKKEIAKK